MAAGKNRSPHVVQDLDGQRVLLLTAQRRGLLVDAVDGLGLDAVTGDWAGDALARLEASGARLAIVDARGAIDQAVAVARRIGASLAARGGAMLVLVSAGDVGALDALLDAGATHFLAGSVDAERLTAAIRYAARHADRGKGRDEMALPVDAPGQSADAARAWLHDAMAAGEPVSVAVVGLGRFDIVNTAYGRVAGDALLRAALARIGDAVRPALPAGSIVARLDGAEFIIGVTGEGAALQAASARIVDALSQPFIVDGAVIVTGCRIGVAEARRGDGAAALLRRASEALSQARVSDNVTVEIAAADPRPIVPLDRLAVDLRKAIEQGDIHIVFQPQVAIASDRIVGVEALARWEHPELGPLGAEMLFAAAERAALAATLSDHLQLRVLADAAAWPAALSGLRLSINLTAADLSRPGFADLLLDRIDASGFPRARLTVELTETGLVADLGAAATLLASLRTAGCRVAIDDFGTGYSSLAYLKALPLDYLKIDKKLAQDITGSARDRVVVRGVIDMARSLGLTVIAEGVETVEQRDLLASEGCQLYQGFLCSPAVDSAALAGLVAKEG